MPRQDFDFGEWPSAISAASVALGGLRFGKIQCAGRGVYWTEGRPAEGGRATIMHWSEMEGLRELLPAPYSARSRVHEYGGGEFLVAGEWLFFVNDRDQDIYRLSIGAPETIDRLTARENVRFADFAYDAKRGRLIVVAEIHAGNHGDALPVNELWAISVETSDLASNGERLVAGSDFYANPRLDPEGRRLAYLTWNLPDMPWDAAALHVAEIRADGGCEDGVHIAGGNGSACFQPEWLPDGSLVFVWDADRFGNLYSYQAGKAPAPVTHLEAELSMPAWNFHAASYAPLSERRFYLAYTERGDYKAAIFDAETGALAELADGLVSTQCVSGAAGKVAMFAATESEPQSVFIRDVGEGAEVSAPAIVRRSSSLTFEPGFIPTARRVEIPSAGGEIAYGIYYAPKNPNVIPPEAAPPLVISLHGGPTAASARGLRPRMTYFTSRGFAWLDLDYAGSTGYGRAYRDRLAGNWGIADVADTIAAAEFAASQKLADPRAIFVTGGSAGGYTVLMAIASSKLFRGAASYYGICDLVALQHTTHKFEQGYQSRLLGASLAEDEALYRERSALSHIDRIETPLIIFQGSEDHVVPKEQATMMADALKAKGIPVEYHEFEGEGHGFRNASSIERTLELELGFYQRLLPSR